MTMPVDPDEHLAEAQLPDSREEVHNFEGDGTTWILLDDGYEVYPWHPLSDGQGEPTQVHLTFRRREDRLGVVMRFKSSRAVNELIAVMRKYRDEVWPH